MTAKTYRVGPFPAGMTNRAPDFALKLPMGAGHLLRDALNVDITTEGSVKTRKGYTRALAAADGHSLWAPPSGAYALYCDAGAVYRLDVSDGSLTKTLIAPGMGVLAPVRYAQVNEAVYFTDTVSARTYHPTPGPTADWGSAQATQVGDRQLVPMPPGSAIAHHGGRLLVAVGQALIYSEPFTPHLRDPARGFEMFPAPITCISAVERGVVVVADKTYWVAGGFPAQEVRAVLEYGAPAQQPVLRPDGSAQWMSARGVAVCSKDGEIKNVQEERMALQVAGEAATFFRESDGTRTVVVSLPEPGSLAAGVGSYAQARIVRKDTTA